MNIHVFPFKVQHKYIIKEQKEGTRFFVVQILESSERATSKIVPISQRLFEASYGKGKGQQWWLYRRRKRKNIKSRV